MTDNICPKCMTKISSSAPDHASQVCSWMRFRNIEAPKYNMVSVYGMLSESKYTFDYVAGNLANIYPKLASKPIRVNGIPADLFVESWGADAIRLYIKNNGFGDMCLADFISKMADDRHAIKPK